MVWATSSPHSLSQTINNFLVKFKITNNQDGTKVCLVLMLDSVQGNLVLGRVSWDSAGCICVSMGGCHF